MAGWDSNIAGYEAAFGALARQTVEAMLDAARVTSGRRVLDVCCGPGMRAGGVPAARIARKLDKDFFIGVEYYGDYGKIGNFAPPSQQQQLLFAVTDFKLGVFDIDFGLGFGLTSG